MESRVGFSDERHVSGVDIEQHSACEPAKLVTDSFDLRPVILKQFDLPCGPLFQNLRREIGCVTRGIGTCKVEEVRWSHDAHLDRAKFIVTPDKFRHVLAESLYNGKRPEAPVGVPLAYVRIDTIENFTAVARSVGRTKPSRPEPSGCSRSSFTP